LGWDAYPVARLDSDAASQRVKADLRRWGVHLDYVACAPTKATPIVVQEIRRDKTGSPRHRFSWSCLNCGTWLPSYQPVTASSVEPLAAQMAEPTVFFMDRLSRASLMLASAAAARGAVVVFEPSARSDDRLLREALRIAHIVKYADERFHRIDGVFTRGTPTLVEVQTLGAEGLRFRHRLNLHGVNAWKKLPAIKAPVLKDAAGSGDWCTAGLLSRIAKGGQAGLANITPDALQEALRFGQALAAWNCGFEGARGGMYAVDKQGHETQVREILHGQSSVALWRTVKLRQHTRSITCPACPPHNVNAKRGNTLVIARGRRLPAKRRR
jgi:sugar/nucleoside kinase (ribokinase family)